MRTTARAVPANKPMRKGEERTEEMKSGVEGREEEVVSVTAGGMEVVDSTLPPVVVEGGGRKVEGEVSSGGSGIMEEVDVVAVDGDEPLETGREVADASVVVGGGRGDSGTRGRRRKSDSRGMNAKCVLYT